MRDPVFPTFPQRVGGTLGTAPDVLWHPMNLLGLMHTHIFFIKVYVLESPRMDVTMSSQVPPFHSFIYYPSYPPTYISHSTLCLLVFFLLVPLSPNLRSKSSWPCPVSRSKLKFPLE